MKLDKGDELIPYVGKGHGMIVSACKETKTYVVDWADMHTKTYDEEKLMDIIKGLRYTVKKCEYNLDEELFKI